MKKKGEYSFYLDPLFNFELGKDNSSNTYGITNTRGVAIFGTIGKQFSYSTNFFENQSYFVQYVQQYIDKHQVVPGQGNPKVENGRNGQKYYDYAYANGYISYSPSKYFNFQLGHDKLFIGDGYRSLFLSDNSFNAPFFKITSNFWKIQYTNIYTQYMDLGISAKSLGFGRKFASYQYLSFNANKYLSFGLCEGIIFQGKDSLGNRGFDLNYINPIIFLRPVEFSVGSPDNVVLGFNFKIKPVANTILYGQVFLDEFKLDEVMGKNGKGWSNNKQGIQAGFHLYNLLNIKNLHIQGEYNYVRPFTYTHDNPTTNYGHYNQPLAHTLGANFSEFVGIGDYRYKSFRFNVKYVYAITGADSAGYNFGNDIYKPYLSAAHAYGNQVGQKYRTPLSILDAKISYVVNPRYNMQVSLGITRRHRYNDLINEQTNYIYFGFRTAISNLYYDF